MSLVEKVYNYTGALQALIVPAGVSEILFECWGAAGGASYAAGKPSNYVDHYWNTSVKATANSWQGANGGGYVAARVPVAEGARFDLAVGGNGDNAGFSTSRPNPGGNGGWPDGGKGGDGYAPRFTPYNSSGGGGGGGSTDVRFGAATDPRILVAGASGGTGGSINSGAGTIQNPTTPSPPYGVLVTDDPNIKGDLVTYYISSGAGTGGYAGVSGNAGGDGVASDGSPFGSGGGGASVSAGGAGGSGSGASGGGNGSTWAGYAGGAGGSAYYDSSLGATRGWHGGGGGGGGRYGGGGGAAGGSSSGAGGGGGSNYVASDADLAALGYATGVFTDTVDVSHAFPPAWRGASGYGGLVIATYRQLPSPPTFSNPVNGDAVDATTPLTVSLGFTSPMPGISFSSFDLRYRLSPSGAWTTLSGLSVTGTMGSHTFPAGTFTIGDSYDFEARVTDEDGDTGDWSMITVLAVAPPPAPIITGPASPEHSAAFDVTWTQSSGDTQSDYQLQILDETGAVIYNSGIVASAVGSHHVVWTAPSEEALTLRVAYTVAPAPDIWSPWGSEPFEVNIDPPGVPIVLGQADDDTGTVAFDITAVDTPHMTTTVDIYRRDLTHDESEIRLASGLLPDPVTRKVLWTDYTPGNRTLYRYRVRANSAAGGFAYV